MSTILMLALGSGMMAVGLLILAILWKSRASRHSLPGQGPKEKDTDIPSRPSATPSVAVLVGSEKSGVMSAVNELAQKIIIETDRVANEEARRAADVEAVKDSPRAIVAEAEQKAQQILKNAAGRAQDAIKAVRMTTDSVTDEFGSALTNINDLLPASNDPADGSNDKLGVGNGHVTVLASVTAIRKRSQTMKGSADYTKQGKEGPAERLRTIEAERVHAVNEGLEDAAKLASKELVPGQTGEGAHSKEQEAGRFGGWELKKHGWWRGIFWTYSR